MDNGKENGNYNLGLYTVGRGGLGSRVWGLGFRA